MSEDDDDARSQREARLRGRFENVRNARGRELDLSGLQLTDDDAAVVVAEELQHPQIGTLKTLILNDNLIGKKGAEALAKALKKNSTLEVLELNNNDIHNKAAVAIAKALKVNTGLKTVSLNRNNIGPGACPAIQKALKTNETLRVLDLSHNYIGDEGAASIADGLKWSRALMEFVLDHNEIGEEGGKAIANALTEYPVLHTLSLRDNRIADKAAARFAAAIETDSRLACLVLSGNRISSVGATAIARALETNSKLVSLILQHNIIDSVGTTAIARSLHANATLTVLGLWNNHIGAEGVIAIMNALKVNATLQGLSLNGINADVAAATAVREALQVDSALTGLQLSLGRNSMRAVARALLVNTTLQCLYLQFNNMEDDEAVAFAEALKVNTRLQVLNLENNGIGSAGFAALSDALMFNSTPSLRQLDLQGNIIDNDGVNLLTNIQVSLAMGALDRFFQSVRFKLERGLSTSITFPYELTLGSGRANVLALSLQENAAVTELGLPLEEEWTSEDIGGNLAPLLHYIEQSDTLAQLTYFLRKGSTATEDRRTADIDVMRSFFAAVANRAVAIDFTLAVNLRWLNDNVHIFQGLMQSNFSFLTKLIAVDYGSGRGELDGILNRGTFASALELDTVGIGVATPCEQWLERWEASAHGSPLRVFFLKVEDLRTLRQFSKTLPALIHLQELRVEFVGAAAVEMRRSRHTDFLAALKQNGSLRIVHVRVQDDDDDDDDDEDNNGIPQGLRRQVELYCRRNQLMPRPMKEGSVHADQNNANNGNRVAAGGAVPPRPPPLSCYPKLCYQSSQCPAGMGPSWMLRGLLALKDSVCTTTTAETNLPPADR